MSNDMSNEQGNAAQAFQVGDRVEAFKSWGGGRGYYQAARVVAVLRSGRYRVRPDVGNNYRIVSADDLRAPEPSAASEPATPAPTAMVDLQQVERSISAAFAAINDAGSLSTDQTEDVVCRALDAIGAALGDLRNAVRQLSEDHQARS